MLEKAILQAEQCLFRCQLELKKLQDSTRCDASPNQVDFDVDLQQINHSWKDFVASSNKFFSMLKLGAKSNTKSEPWFGRISHFRKKDELLNYMHQARHGEEHELEEIIEFMNSDSSF